jgi:flagellar biogenesis protein FliO
MRGNYDYIKKQGATIVRIYAMYEPLKFFVLTGATFCALGVILLLRYLFYRLTGEATGARYVQSVIAGGSLLTIGILMALIGLIADLISNVRRLQEDTLYRVKKMELQMERERDKREQLLAGILNFDQPPTPAPPPPTAVPTPTRRDGPTPR